MHSDVFKAEEDWTKSQQNDWLLGLLCYVLGWHTRGFGGLVVGLDVHLMGYCRECWKFWFDDMKHKAEFLGTSVGWDLESSFIVPICRNIFHFRV